MYARPSILLLFLFNFHSRLSLNGVIPFIRMFKNTFKKTLGTFKGKGRITTYDYFVKYAFYIYILSKFKFFYTSITFSGPRE